MSTSSVILCKPTNWFYFRALTMVAMFSVFALYFLYDWNTGYRKKNLIHYSHKAFEEAGAQREKIKEQSDWEQQSASKNLSLPSDKRILPKNLKTPIPWPNSLKKIGTESNETNNWRIAWLQYSNAQGWPSEASKKSHDAQTIQEQLYWAIGSGILALIALYFYLRTTQRSIRVDEEAYYAPNGKKIPYQTITKIDKRKWETKGLAYLFYKDEQGHEQKSKVDGLVYGQFKKEDGAPAEALFQQILANFSGELIEFAPEEDEDEQPTSSPKKEEKS